MKFSATHVGRGEIKARERHEIKGVKVDGRAQRETGDRMIGWGAYLGISEWRWPCKICVRLLFIGSKRGSMS